MINKQTKSKNIYDDSVLKRFSANLAGTIVLFTSTLIINSLIPKSFGPTLYGAYGYCLSILESIFNFIKSGIFQAYYNYNSRNENSYYANLWIMRFVSLSILIIFIIICLTSHFFSNALWSKINLSFILLTFVIVITREIFGLINDYGHSKSLTVPIQKIRILSLVIQSSLIFIAFYNKYLSFNFFVAVIVFTNIFFKIVAYFIFKKKNILGFKIDTNNHANKKLTKYFFKFSYPIITISLLSTLSLIFDRWFLQTTSGLINQGYYHFAERFSLMILMINSSIIPIMQKEIVQIKDNIDLVKETFAKYLSSFTFFVFFIVIALLFNVNSIIDIFLDERYADAALVISIVLVSTVFRFFGQFYNVLIISIDKTKIIRNVGFVSIFLGLFLTIFLLSDKRLVLINGLNLGAVGLSLKLLIVELVNATILYLVINKILSGNKMIFLKTFKIIIFLFSSMYISSTIAKQLFQLITVNSQILISITGFLMYTLVCVIALFSFPGFFEINIKNIIFKIKYFLTSKSIN